MLTLQVDSVGYAFSLASAERKIMRQSGRTFRAVLQAVADASAGNHVVFVSNTRPHADTAMRFANQFTQGIGGLERYKDRIAFRHVNSPECGSFEVTTEEIYTLKEQHGGYRGLKRLQVVFDA